MTTFANDLVDFANIPKFADLFDADTADSDYIQTSTGDIARFPISHKGRTLKVPRLCEEGNVVAIAPEEDQNIVAERYWYGIVTRAGPEVGHFAIRWFTSAKYIRRSLHKKIDPPLVENKDELAQALKDFNVPTNVLYLSDVVDDLKSSKISCVLTNAEFATLNFDDKLQVKWEGTICKLTAA